VSNNPDRIAFKLVETALSRLVVRAAIHYVGIPEEKAVDIYLLSYCKPLDEDAGRLFEVNYRGRSDPTGWYEEDEVVVVRSLHPHLVYPVLAHEHLAAHTRKMEERLLDWQKWYPFWDSDREIVAYTEDRYGGACAELYPSNLRLMLHFVRLHGLLLARGQNTPNAWETEDLLKRLGAFLKDRMQDWDRVLG
jgi:hypothetical protein